MQYPILDPFFEIGTLILERDGLYFRYRGEITTQKTGFIRLYRHSAGNTVPLGLFRDLEGVSVCEGRLSARAMGEPDGAHFSICKTPWMPIAEDGVFTALQRSFEDGREVIVPLQDTFPEKLLPYFCFLQQKTVEGASCLSLMLDKQGSPFLAD